MVSGCSCDFARSGTQEILDTYFEAETHMNTQDGDVPESGGHKSRPHRRSWRSLICNAVSKLGRRPETVMSCHPVGSGEFDVGG